ncbi:hypothetical protein PR048_024771, partial [Dryococelus australis]
MKFSSRVRGKWRPARKNYAHTCYSAASLLTTALSSHLGSRHATRKRHRRTACLSAALNDVGVGMTPYLAEETRNGDVCTGLRDEQFDVGHLWSRGSGNSRKSLDKCVLKHVQRTAVSPALIDLLISSTAGPVKIVHVAREVRRGTVSRRHPYIRLGRFRINHRKLKSRRMARPEIESEYSRIQVQYPLVHTVFDISWRTLTQSSPSTVAADNQCAVDVGIFVLQSLAFSSHEMVRFPAWSSPNFRKWESCRTMPLVNGFSPGSPVYATLAFRRCSILTSLNSFIHSRNAFNNLFRNNFKFSLTENNLEEEHKK